MRPTVARINLNALRHNLETIRRVVGEEVGIIPVVKADAYGHGAVAISWVLAEAGIDLMCVACLEEALDLADAGVPARFLILGGLFEKSAVVETPPNCIPVVWDEEGIKIASALPSSVGRPIEIHLKVNTGMSRLGCEPHQVPSLFKLASQYSHIRITGVMSHLSSADGKEEDDEAFTRKQIGDFHALCKPIGMGILRHLAASSAIVKYPESHFDAVRPGLMLYGIWPFDDYAPVNGLSPKDIEPVMSLVTKVMAVREVEKNQPIGYGRSFSADKSIRIAVLPAGYADGVNRKLSNRGQVLIGGKRRNIVGRVSMDFITVDISDPPPVSVGDEAVLIGKQGGEEITVWEFARWAETIPYEVTCRIGGRVPRVIEDIYY